MNEKGYTRESALDWFKTDECEEAYDGYIVNGIYEPTNENFSDVVKEVFFDCGYYKSGNNKKTRIDLQLSKIGVQRL